MQENLSKVENFYGRVIINTSIKIVPFNDTIFYNRDLHN